MHFLIDADLPRDTSTLLNSYGHLGTDVRDVGMRKAKDFEIAFYAKQNRLSIVTCDWGFADVRVYLPENYFGIVVIGLAPHATRQVILSTFALLLERSDLLAILPGRLAVVEKNRIRLRPVP